MALRVIAQETVRERYVYDPETGIFTYRIARPGRFAGAVAGSKQASANRWAATTQPRKHTPRTWQQQRNISGNLPEQHERNTYA